MALSSSSTVTDALAQYNDNLDWETSATKAQNALYAIRFLLRNRGNSLAFAGRSISFESLEKEAEEIKQYLDAIDGSTRRTHFVQARPL